MALTLRLDDAENKELDDLKERFQVSTATAAIKQMIMSYQQTLDKLNQFQEKSYKLELEQEAFKTQMDSYFKSQKNLSKLLYNEPNQTTIDAFNETDLEPMTMDELRAMCE